LILAAALAVPPVVLLPSCLSGNSQATGNRGPSDTQSDCVVDKRCEFRLGAVASQPGTLDSFK
jgi:hypothetical protein